MFEAWLRLEARTERLMTVQTGSSSGSAPPGKEEQLKRFRERERLHYKSWKLTEEDWRNRGKWEEHLQAADEMILKTSTHRAPWVIVEANDKLYARVKVLRSVERALREGLASGRRPLDWQKTSCEND